GEAPSQPIDVSLERPTARLLSPSGRIHDLGCAQVLSGEPGMVGGEPRAGQPCLDASLLAAVAVGSRDLVGSGPRQRVVAPFASGAIGSGTHGPVHDDASTDAGSEDDAEDDLGAGGRPVDGV